MTIAGIDLPQIREFACILSRFERTALPNQLAFPEPVPHLRPRTRAIWIAKIQTREVMAILVRLALLAHCWRMLRESEMRMSLP
jgi:hypothetical protein